METAFPIKGIALDIDDVLASTNLYWAEKLHEQFGSTEGLTPLEIKNKYRYMQSVPGWDTEDALQWMRHAQTSNEIQIELPLLENARHVVNELSALVSIAAYVTGRPEQVREGTTQWLARHEFPEAPLIMRPDTIPHEGWWAWKAKTLYSSFPQLVGIVDDDPGFIELLPPDYKGVVFLYGTAERPETTLNVVSCRNWEDLLAASHHASALL